ncbi:hypothetical protein Tco_0246822 [Tanacetum coccineum]
MSKVKKAWKPKQVWKAIGKLLTNIGYQWKPMGRKFILGEQCPLTRLTKSKVVLAKQTENVSTSKIMITEKLSHTSQKPLTRYQRRTKQYKAIPTSFPTLTENEAIDASLHSTVASANQQEPNKNWGSIFLNSPSLSIFKCRHDEVLPNLLVVQSLQEQIMVMASSFKPLELWYNQLPCKKGFRPAPTFLMPGQISSGLVPNPVLAAPYVPATNKDLEILFQLMFDEYLEPRSAERLVSSATAVQVPVISAGTPSSTTIDQDAPSPSHSPSSSGLQPPISHQGVAAGSTIIEDNPFAHADNDPFVNVFAPEPNSDESLERISKKRTKNEAQIVQNQTPE